MLAYSFQPRAFEPVSVAPLMPSQPKGVLTRDRHSLQSTDFSFSQRTKFVGEPQSKCYLVGHNPARKDAAIVHYTLGGPFFDE